MRKRTTKRFRRPAFLGSAMPFGSASDRAFRLFIEAYGRARAPPRASLDPQPDAQPVPPPADEEEHILISDLITKSKAWGDFPF